MQYSIINLQEVKEHKEFRIDPEYYKPEFKKFFDKVTDFKKLGSYIKNGYRVVYENTEILNIEKEKNDNFTFFLQASDILSPEINENRMGVVSNEDWKRYKKGRIKVGELLIEVKGKAEKVAIVPSNFPMKTLVSGSLYKMDLTEDQLPEYVLIFLLCKYGNAFKERCKTNLLISFINKDELYNIPIPSFSYDFRKKIANTVNKSFELSEKSKSLYQQAENLLLEELGLKDWKPKHQLSYIKSYSDTQQAERFDAEYFQPQYDAIIEKIKSYNQKQGIKKEVILDDVVKWSKGVEVGSEQYLDEGFDFIRISDFSSKGISETSKKISSELFAELKGKYSPKKGDILFTKDGTIGLTYLVDQNQDSIVSGAFLKLRPKIDIEAEYLTLVLNSVICKKQIEMMSGGAIIAHLKPSDAMNLQIPILKPEKQQEISSKIIYSKEKDKQSKSLLEIAKKAVEMAIESNEEKATKWIDQELEKLGVRLNSD